MPFRIDVRQRRARDGQRDGNARANRRARRLIRTRARARRLRAGASSRRPYHASRAMSVSRVPSPRAPSFATFRDFANQRSRRSVRSPRVASSTEDAPDADVVADGVVLDACARFAWTWLVFGYAVPSALAARTLGDGADASTSLAAIAATCETVKAAAATVIVLDADEGVMARAKRASGVAMVREGCAYGVGAAVAARAVDGASGAVFGSADAVAERTDVSTLVASGSGAATAFGAFAAACVAAPFLEELFFRGFLLEQIEARTRSRAMAIAVSSVVFASAHFSIRDFASLTTCGVAFALAKTGPGGLGASFAAHALFNASVLIERAATSS